MRFILPFILGLVIFLGTANAGNPDRQGEAGATELLLNPWARSVRGIQQDIRRANGQ